MIIPPCTHIKQCNVSSSYHLNGAGVGDAGHLGHHGGHEGQGSGRLGGQTGDVASGLPGSGLTSVPAKR